MATMTNTKTETSTGTGTDVREVAAATDQEIIAIFTHYGRTFPYDKNQLRHDIAQIFLFDMTDGITVQFYDAEKVERVSYAFVPGTNTGAVHSSPGTFPRHEIPEGLRVRVVLHKGALPTPMCRSYRFATSPASVP